MAITGRDIEHLLYTDILDPILVVHDGAPEIVAAAELGACLGAVVVCSRSEVVRRVGERDLSEDDLAGLAAALSEAIADPARPRLIWPA
jgi:hypothetical protein